MRNITIGLWLVLAGVALQLSSLITNYFSYRGEPQSAWMGLPTTAELILFCAVVAAIAVGLAATRRSPLTGSSTGLLASAAGVIAALQLSYRMIAPPFGGEVPDHVTILGNSCLFWCLPSQAEPAQILPGAWVALAGCLSVALGGLLHSQSRSAKQTNAVSWVAPIQTGLTPWLSLAALGAVGQLVFGFTFFSFFRTIGRSGTETTWSGWLPMPHTASWIFVTAIVILLLVRAASRRRAPLEPFALGGLIAALAAIASVRIWFRILTPPFGPTTQVEILPGAYLSLITALLCLLAAIVHAVRFRNLRPGEEIRT
ncbi:MAG: hypothetical protein H0W65_08345 [Sphingomonas sp.]|uniref:hypothetical protein n=1 Tax=Sphingomonas sp. TaxID=28214 RepID=UPI00185A143A|nr:hypothetical protein [Sphingomonas sp.]MBA3667718.1 hypothetical protein [Sphingomonas sp.]